MSDLAVIKKLKVVELKAALGARGLAVKGKKDELVKRLMEAMESDEQQQEADSSPQENTEIAEEATEDSSPETSQNQEGSPDETIEDKEAPDEAIEDKEETEESTEPPTAEEAETVDGAADQDSNPDEEPVSNEQDSPTAAAAAEDWVMVEPPNTDETAAVKEAVSVQEEALKDTQDDSQEQPAQGATVDTPSEDVEMTDGKTSEEPTTTDSAEPMEATSNTDENKAQTGETKPAETVKSPEKTEEKKEEEIIPDVMVEVEEEEGEEFVPCVIPEGCVGLDQYTSDMHFIVSNNGLSGSALSKNGFGYLWSGARANKGAKGGKLGYEVKITGKRDVTLPEDEAPIHAIRIGWSAESSNMQLGESSLSYGFESTGKVCASSSFFDYGTTFGEGDVIGTYLDLESEPKTLKYTKNGEDLGVAMSLTVNLEEKPLFPHILLRNVTVELNFGGSENPWFEILEGYTLIEKGSEENTTQKTMESMAEDEQCEIILMVGLPSAGKSVWVRKYCEAHPEKQYNVISIQTLLDRCKLEGKRRRKGDKGHEELMKAMIKGLTKLFHLCPKRRRNFIYDQTNVYKSAQNSKMELFTDFKRKAVVIVPTHDNLRRRTSDAKRKGESVHEVPFADLCDMKCQFNIPEQGDVFEEVSYPELDEKNAGKTVRDYHSDGTRAKKTGRDEYYPKKKPRYDDRNRHRDNRYGGGGRDRREDGGWARSGSGYGGYSDAGGYNKGRSNQSGGNNRRSHDNRRQSGGGGGYRQNSYGSGNSSYRGSSGGYGQNYGSYSQSNYGSYGGAQNYGGYNYSNYNQYNAQGARGTAQWGQQQQQYGAAYNATQTPATTQQWGAGGQWGTTYNYNTGTGSGSYGGSGYSY